MNDKEKIEVTVDKQKTFIMQRGFLEDSIRGLKDKFRKNNKGHKQENKRIMKENVDLIGAINELRRERNFKEKKSDYDKLLTYKAERIDVLLQLSY